MTRPFGRVRWGLPELAATAAVAALIGSLVAPRLQATMRRARANAVLADAAAIRAAALQTRLDTGRFPDDGRWGEVPEAMKGRLAAGAFRRGDRRYLWWTPAEYRGLLVYTGGDPAVLVDVARRYPGVAYRWGRYCYLVMATEPGS